MRRRTRMRAAENPWRLGAFALMVGSMSITDDAAETSEHLTFETARAVLAAYDLPSDARLVSLGSGNNTTFQVTADGTRYVLRVHRPGYRTAANIRAELHYLQRLRAVLDGTVVQVPQPVPCRDGRLVVEAGLRYCDLLTWLDGHVLVPGQGLGPHGVHDLGHTLGRLHNAAELIGPQFDGELPSWDADGMFVPAASPFRPVLELDEILSENDRPLFDEIADRTRTIFDVLNRDGAYGIIHADYILGNVFLRRQADGWQTGVFDFDDCGFGYYLYDLCPLLGNLAGYPGAILDNPYYPALREAFLDGYRTIRSLPREWDRHLPVLMAARQANHCLLTARPDVSPTPRHDAAWRMSLARRCLALAA